MERWRGKTALVTGASVGIGFAITEVLIQSGVNVIACARNPAPLEVLRQEIPSTSGELTPVKCDLSKEGEILTMFQKIQSKFGHVDILVNNVGSAVLGNLLESETEEWQQMLNLNILGTTICTREALKLMKKTGVDDGHIININSVAGHQIIGNGFHFYSGTKHMITALTKALNAELREKKSKIRVTSLSPGLVNTRLIEDRKKDSQHGEKFRTYLDFRALEGKDIANAVLYVLGAPPHVCIKELTIAPTEQFDQ